MLRLPALPGPAPQTGGFLGFQLFRVGRGITTSRGWEDVGPSLTYKEKMISLQCSSFTEERRCDD